MEMIIHGCFYLMATHDHSLGAIVTLEKTLPITVVISWNPDRLLGVIGLEHVVTLHLHGDNQVREWIWIRLPSLSKLDVTGHVEEEDSNNQTCWNSEKAKLLKHEFLKVEGFKKYFGGTVKY